MNNTPTTKGRWGIHQLNVEGKVTGGFIGCGYRRKIDAQVECVRSAARATYTRCDFVVFDRGAA